MPATDAEERAVFAQFKYAMPRLKKFGGMNRDHFNVKYGVYIQRRYEKEGTDCRVERGVYREKDGLWAVLFWLQILAVRRCSVAEIMEEHWKSFGRHYYSRHDYEAVASEAAHGLYDRLEGMLPSLVGQAFAGRKISTADNFSYTDPVDGSVTKGQGLRLLLDDGSRVVIRLSGTGTKGATIRIYLESYVPSSGDLNQDPQVALADMISAINDLAEIKQRTSMDQPTVIT